VADGDQIDTSNNQLVGMQGKTVIVAFPTAVMSPENALRHAAWLVAVAEAVAPELDFAAVLEAVRNT
jgi:hypothetical protein